MAVASTESPSLIILWYIITKVNENRIGDARVKPCQIFDIIGGKSTRGYVWDKGLLNYVDTLSLIAIMLGKLGMDVDECIVAYKSLFEQVFGKKNSFLPTT
jgi:hypothetical protein